MGFWRKLGKVASFAAPIIAAPFTGGATLALIGAGAGASSAALSGKGLKGSLLDAGLGAIPGLGKAGALGGSVKNAMNNGTGVLGKVLGKGGGAPNASVADGVKEVATKSLGGKLMDSLTSPDMLKAGIGAGLEGLFGHDPAERQGFKGQNDPNLVLRKLLQSIGKGGLARINLSQQPFRRPTVAPINFNPQVEGLPFKLGLNTPGLGGGEQAPQASDPALEELKRILGGL